MMTKVGLRGFSFENGEPVFKIGYKDYFGVDEFDEYCSIRALL